MKIVAVDPGCHDVKGKFVQYLYLAGFEAALEHFLFNYASPISLKTNMYMHISTIFYIWFNRRYIEHASITKYV